MAVSTNKNVKPNLNNADLSFFDVCLNKNSRLWMLTPRDSIDLTDVTTRVSQTNVQTGKLMLATSFSG